MFEKCTSLRSLDLSSFYTNSAVNMESMFSGDINLVYINFQRYTEMSSNLILDNIFLGTLKNMMFCLRDYRTSKLKEIIEQKVVQS